ncbi:hypothetical protein OFM15_31065, partial [Escherichia coli]|nr:hypothetical protein [Escherichia coli]
QQCLQAVWLGPERHCFHEVRVWRVCLLVDTLKTASLPVPGNILFSFTGSESSSKYLVPEASDLLMGTREVLKFNW